MLNTEKILTSQGIAGTWASYPERPSEMRRIASVLNRRGPALSAPAFSVSVPSTKVDRDRHLERKENNCYSHQRIFLHRCF